MIKNDAIALASEIIETQKKAVIEKVAEGVLVCTDTLKGKYQFVTYDNVIIKGFTLGQWIARYNELHDQHNKEQHKSNYEIAELIARVKLLEHKVEMIVDVVDNDGDPLATNEPLSAQIDSIEQGE